MHPPPPPTIQLGINGIHILRNGALYFTTTLPGQFVRVPIHPDGTAAGPSQVITSNGPNDDFIFDSEGNAYIGQDVANTC